MHYTNVLLTKSMLWKTPKQLTEFELYFEMSNIYTYLKKEILHLGWWASHLNRVHNWKFREDIKLIIVTGITTNYLQSLDIETTNLQSNVLQNISKSSSLYVEKMISLQKKLAQDCIILDRYQITHNNFVRYLCEGSLLLK